MKIAQDIKDQQDKDSMLRRSLERIVQLYTDKSHFIYELLQNAEDTGAKQICFAQYDDRLEVMHNGRPFTKENLQRLCDVGLSDKINDLNQIGEFGVGFKSVFTICKTVKIFSSPNENESSEDYPPFAIEIQDFIRPEDIDPEPVRDGYQTRFVFPYCVGESFSGFKNEEELKTSLTERLKGFGTSTLLFLRNIEQISYEIWIPGQETSGTYALKKEDKDGYVCIYDCDTERKERFGFMKFSKEVDGTASKRTIDIAFPFVKNENGTITFQKAADPYISVFFPTTTESKLDFVVNGPFRTTPDRGQVPFNEENKELAQQMAELLRKSVLKLRDDGLLDLNLIKALPIDETRFYYATLFQPLHAKIWELFYEEDVLPKQGGGYVTATEAVIARGRKLAELCSDDDLSALYADDSEHAWLSLELTENGPFSDVYEFFSNSIDVQVLSLTDLKSLFNQNPEFLQSKDNDWLAKLYELYQEIGKNNVLDAVIVKTESEAMVAPYHRVKEGGYVPNVFLPMDGCETLDVEFVNHALYEKCKSFFDDYLGLKQPDEYEFFVKTLRERYASPSKVAHDAHIEDTRKAIAFLKKGRKELKEVLGESFYLHCKASDGKDHWLHPYRRILFPRTESGLEFEEYYKGLGITVYFIDRDQYYGISDADLRLLGVTDSILINSETTYGYHCFDSYSNYQKFWHTKGDFRWELDIEAIEKALLYISNNPAEDTSKNKSLIIFDILKQNYSKLFGKLLYGERPTYERDDIALIVRKITKPQIYPILRNWNGKWLYTKDDCLVSPGEITKYDLNEELYGKVELYSPLYKLLGFKEDREADMCQSISSQLDSLPPERVLDMLVQKLKEFDVPRQAWMPILGLSDGLPSDQADQTDDDDVFCSNGYQSDDFPQRYIPDMESLRKYVELEFLCADPVKYEERLRSIRTSKCEQKARAYIFGMYTNRSGAKLCQMCRTKAKNPRIVEIANFGIEMSQLHLCLCYDCEQQYKSRRDNNKDSFKSVIAKRIQELDIDDPSESYAIRLDDQLTLYFTQTHLAEIQEILSLLDQYGTPESSKKPQ